MRYRIACLIISWIIGIGSGAFDASYLFLAVCLVATAFCLYAAAPGKQVFVAALLLLPLGFFYGDSIHAGYAQDCIKEPASRAQLVRTYSFSPTQSRYVFKRNDGCSLLVYASRYPVLVRGTYADIIGEQESSHDAFSYLPEYASALEDDGILLVVLRAQLENIEGGQSISDRIRLGTMASLTKIFREPGSSLFVAMLAGDQGMVPSSIKDAYRKTGIIHILSISGLHISLIALVTAFLVGSLPIRQLFQSFIIIVLLWWYIAIVGFPESGVRAGVFWTLYAIAYRARALIGIPTVILLTLAVLITLNPTIIKSIGFELSVAAVSGIAIALFFQKRMQGFRRGKFIIGLFTVSLGATLATAPLTLYYFGNLSFLGLFANFLVVPLIPLAMYLALFALLLFPLLPLAAMVIAYPAHLLANWIVFVAMGLSRVPYGYIEEVQFPLWAVGAYYLVLVCGIIVLMKHFRISARQLWV